MKRLENINQNGYAIAHDDGILVTEKYLMKAFLDLCWLEIEDEDDLRVVAKDEGFKNLGDYGSGYLFYFDPDDDMTRSLVPYFE